MQERNEHLRWREKWFNEHRKEKKKKMSREQKKSLEEHEMHKITTFVEHCKSCKTLLHDSRCFLFSMRMSKVLTQNFNRNLKIDILPLFEIIMQFLREKSIKNLESILTLWRRKDWSLNFRFFITQKMNLMTKWGATHVNELLRLELRRLKFMLCNSRACHVFVWFWFCWRISKILWKL